MVKYEVTTKNKCLIVTCYAHLRKDDLSEFGRTLWELDAQIPSKDVNAIIFDFIGQTMIDHHFIKVMAPTLKSMRQHGKKLFAVNVPVPSVKIINDNGLSGAIQISDNLQEVLARFAPPPPKISAPHLDVNFINPFIQGTLETFRIQGMTEIKVGKPLLKGKSNSSGSNFEISGVVGYSLQTYGGYIAISFPEKVFLNLMSKMLGKPFSEITSAIEDGAAEFLNIICGHAKKNLIEKNYNFQLAAPKTIPSVLRGGQKIKDRLTSPTAMLIPFELEGGAICLEISGTV
jgi:chemotaxis protein CheX